MSKSATIRQIETAKRELDRGIASVLQAWRETNPVPTWEQERQWEEENHSPRRRYQQQEHQFSRQFRKEADALMLRINMGEVSNEEAYAELKKVLDRFNEQRLALLGDKG